MAVSDLPLTKTAETNNSVTLSWTPVPGAAGYVFYRDGRRVSNSWDPNKNSVTFTKSTTYKVEAIAVTAAGVYPPTTPPPPPPPPPSSVVIGPATLPAATAGVAYNATLTVTGPTPPYTVKVTQGVTPTGLALSTDGKLTGTPATAGTFRFTVSAFQGTTYVAFRDYTFTVQTGTTPPPPPPPPSGNAYNFVTFDESAFPVPGFHIATWAAYSTGITGDRVDDPLRQEGKVLRLKCAYVPGYPTDYQEHGLQQVALGVDSKTTAHAAKGMETWYREKFMVPSGNHFCNGFSNFMVEWHTNASGPTSSGLFAYGGYPLTPQGTTTAKLPFVLRWGNTSSPTARYFPGNTTDLQAAANAAPAFTPDVWHDCVFHFIWHDDPAIGLFEWWIDGKRLASVRNPTFYSNPGELYGWAVYNYRYHVTGDSTIYYAIHANGPTAASVGFTPPSALTRLLSRWR